jgi:hypothetical protein
MGDARADEEAKGRTKGKAEKLDVLDSFDAVGLREDKPGKADSDRSADGSETQASAVNDRPDRTRPGAGANREARSGRGAGWSPSAPAVGEGRSQSDSDKGDGAAPSVGAGPTPPGQVRKSAQEPGLRTPPGPVIAPGQARKGADAGVTDRLKPSLTKDLGLPGEIPPGQAKR